MSRLARLVAATTLLATAACCPKDGCIKEPPCRPCENPCCLTLVQKAALAKGHHALPTPAAYVYEDRTYVLLTEKGAEAFRKDPAAFTEKDAIRWGKGRRTLYVDLNPGREADLEPYANAARPWVPPPPPKS